MTTVKTVGAASRKPLSWAAIEWQTTQRNVRRLPGAYRAGDESTNRLRVSPRGVRKA